MYLLRSPRVPRRWQRALPFHPAAGHPHREAGRVVVASVAVLRPGGAAEFTTPHDQRVFEHVSLFEVGQQRRDRLVDRVAIRGQLGLQIPVLVPASQADLDEPDSRFGEPSREQALLAEIGRPLDADAVRLLSRFGSRPGP